MTKFTSFFRFLWLIVLFSILFIDRDNKLVVLVTIISLIILTLVTIIRALISRNEWRKMINDGDVKIKDKISFD